MGHKPYMAFAGRLGERVIASDLACWLLLVACWLLLVWLLLVLVSAC